MGGPGWLVLGVVTDKYLLLTVKMHEMRVQIPDSCPRDGACSRHWQGKPELVGRGGRRGGSGGQRRQ